MAKKQQQKKKGPPPSITMSVEQPGKGLATDMVASNQPSGTYRFALNAIADVEDGSQGSLATEEGNFKCLAIENAPFPDYNNSWSVIGHVYTNDDVAIVFLTNADNTLSKIVEYNSSTCTTNDLVTSSCMGFSLDYPVQAVYRIRNGCERNIYFTDNLNPPRQLNIDRLDNYVLPGEVYDPNNTNNNVDIWDCGQMRLFPLVQVPCIEYVMTDDTGGVGMIPGSYQIVIRYLDEDLNPTNFFDVSNPIPIYSDDNQSSAAQWNDIAGDLTGGERSTKSVRYRFSNLDPSFTYVQVCCIATTTGTGINDGIAFLLETLPIENNIFIDYRFRGIDPSYAKEISLDEVLIPKIGYEKAKTIEQIDNRLILGNVTSSFVDHAAFQKAACNIQIRYKTRSQETGITIAGGSTEKQANPKGGEYYFYNRSYMRDEVYALGIVWVFQDGSESPAYHIPGRQANRTSTGANIPAPDPNSPGGNPNGLGAEHNRPAATVAGGWDTTQYAADTHNMQHLTPTANNQYPRWKVYNTAIRDSVSYENGGDTLITEGELSFWESDTYRYPDVTDCDGNPIYAQYDNAGNLIQDFTGQFIRHHKLPDTTLEPHFWDGADAPLMNAYNGLSGNFIARNHIAPIGFNLNNINPPIGVAPDGEPWAQKVQGYKIVQIERATGNKSVLDKGIVYYNFKTATYSTANNAGGSEDEFCNFTDIGGAESDRPCWYWFQGNHYNKHIGMYRIRAANNSVDLNPFGLPFGGNLAGYRPSTYVQSGCERIWDESPTSCMHATTCMHCNSASSSCLPLSLINGINWTVGGQNPNTNPHTYRGGYPYHHSTMLTVGDSDTNPPPPINWVDGDSNGTDTRTYHQGSMTYNLSYHGAITNFRLNDPGATHIKVERVLAGS